ncbi:MAG TPA: type III pantothenate kinase [Spirochaetota bacterium]|nr:type III pantothenate kinase [Spirochaetota bacterium]HPJ34908.1 type III pantothenate kinase [Spirochaetota bacterium]
MFLGIDIGNTTTMLALFRDDSPKPEKIMRYRTDKRGDDAELASVLKMTLRGYADFNVLEAEITGIAFSSVVPEISGSYRRVCRRLFSLEAFEINAASRLSISINYKDHGQLGIDRIVNVEAAYHEYGPGCIVVDIGTAATFDVLNFEGCFDGGLISPGIGTTIKALSDAASNLPEIVFEMPDDLIARDTANAIKSGFYYGWISMVEGICDRIEALYGREFRVILTGGFAVKMKEGFKRNVIIDPDLTMRGIKYIFDNM